MAANEDYKKSMIAKMKKLKGKAGELGECFSRIQNFYRYGQDEHRSRFEKMLTEGNKNMQEVLDAGLGEFLEKLAPAGMGKKLSAIILRLPQYNYQDDSYRRSFKSEAVAPYIVKMFQIIQTVYFDWSQFNLNDFLKMSRTEIQEKKYPTPDLETISHLIAYEIDANNGEIIEAVKDIILSDNNVRAVDYTLIKGVARSHNQELYGLMKKLLLAAKLQEGLRQSIFETADDGTLDYFIMMIETALENDLLRFSSCLRAVDVWMGLGYNYEDKRVAEKLLTIGYRCLTEPELCSRYMASQNMMELYGAMWAESVISVEKIGKHIDALLTGEKYQKLAGLYMLNQVGDNAICVEQASKFLEEEDLDILAYTLLNYKLRYGWSRSREDFIKNCRENTFLADPQRRQHDFDLLAAKLPLIPKGGHVAAKKPFDWSHASLEREQVYRILVTIAGYETDSGVMARLIKLADYGNSREKISIIKYLLAPEPSADERGFLFSSLKDKSMPVRIEAVKTLKTMGLTGEEVLHVEDLLKLKTGEIRQNALDILSEQEDENRRLSLGRLLESKTENQRLGGLDILTRMKKQDEVDIKEITAFIEKMPKSTGQEDILIQSLLNTGEELYSSEQGFGLYDAAYRPDFPPITPYGQYRLQDFKNIRGSELVAILTSLTSVIEKHQDHTFMRKERWSDAQTEVILGNLRNLLIPAENEKENSSYTIEDYVLGSVWKAWYEENKIGLLPLIKISYCAAVKTYNNKYQLGYSQWANEKIKSWFGEEEIAEVIHWIGTAKFGFLAVNIIQQLKNDIDKKDKFVLAYDLIAQIMADLTEEEWQKAIYDESKNRTYYGSRNSKSVISDAKEVNVFLGYLDNAEEDEQFIKNLALRYEIGRLCELQYMGLDEIDIARAVGMGVIKIDDLYRTFMRQTPANKMRTYTGNLSERTKRDIEKYPVLAEVSQQVVDRVIEIELKRGDSPTAVSDMAQGIRRHEGVGIFAEILVALGKETLARGYSYSSNYTKKDVLSSLLKACVPAEGDDAKKLKGALNGRIGDKRLLEAAMYAPAWIPIIEDYLKWKGLKSAAWYFYAHTSNSYSVEFETEVARFSPISREEFQDGAFDVKWFKEAYKTLGEERFTQLYNCAKYICDDGTHRRAQLFADAVLGKLDKDQLTAEISDKRNKDKLLSYSLIPFGRAKMTDALERYEFIQQFLKESKKFGAQRRASEAKVSRIAIENLARNLGFEDSLRFTWKMEVLKIGKLKAYFKPKKVEGVSLYIETDEAGQADIAVVKEDKRLKAVPAKLKKHPYVEELKEIKTSLKAQFSRARVSLEKAMENGDEFKFAEILDLLNHPVIKPLVSKLVFKSGDDLGFLQESGLQDAKGNEIPLKKTDKLVIAHCYHLHQSGQWQGFQRYAFENKLVQPFKQIFRELYLINDDERKEKTISRRYAGHQVQPKRTLGLLKSRNWTADYDHGLQKVYYGENIIATIYALADWFSPADIEAPTLETVQFYGRKNYKPVPFEDLNPILFSETMRDVDLVVSVAHVGGVDPMASHSTIEMRSVIVLELARLLKLDNVAVDGNYIKIKGSRGEYSIHLGSAIAHKMGKGAMNIIPVHSQHRGRLFLPFMDEDPKTAEITSKMLLLAEDGKIKDPTIMAQLEG